jgi:DHA1 family multidrug resistance protein-like MFS transporter
MKLRSFLQTTYFAGFLFSFQIALTVYLNSSFLATKIPETLVGELYTASAIIAMIGLFIVPRLIAKLGTKPVLGFLLLANIGNLLTLILSKNVLAIAVSFVLFFSFNTLLYLGFDILIEAWSDPTKQGRVRGTYLTAMNIGFMIAPLLGGFITDRLGFSALYNFAIILAIPVLIILLFRLPNVKNTHPSKTNFFGLVKKFTSHRTLGAVFAVNFTLQFFYAWMVIYTPIFLHQQLDMSWDTIGLLFTIMLSAFVIFQYITGRIADAFKCERGLMMFGLMVMGTATLLITRAPLFSFWGLATLLFITRIGASIVEVVTEAYFFRHVHPDDIGTIGFFRNTYPFAYLIAPTLASVILGFAPLWTLFVVLGIICIIAIFMAMRIK